MMRTISITGDDFGLSREVNRAIARAYDRGVLTRASLMVNGEASAEAVAMARSRPGFPVGLHLAVVDGLATLRPSDIPHLVDSSGRFRERPFAMGLRYQFSRAARRELRSEIRAQLERFAGTGLALSHVDGHHHMQMHPVVLEILIELAAEFSIPAIRLPAEELGLSLSLDPGGAASKVLLGLGFGLLREWGKRRLRGTGIRFSKRVYGLLESGRITEDYLLGLIPRIVEDDVELYCHPATDLPGQRFHGPPDNGPTELAALLSGRVRAAIDRSGLVLSKPPREELAR
jgi:hopanoid biosynthesis associated protein HpnK